MTFSRARGVCRFAGIGNADRPRDVHRRCRGSFTVDLDQESPDQATCSTSYSATGSDSVSATSGGDPEFCGSGSPSKTETIGPAATSVTLGTSNASPVVGQKLTFTATVTVGSPGTGVPARLRWKFTGDAGQICLVALDDTTPDQATCNTSYASPGSDSVTATYEGSSSYGGSTSSPVSESISRAQSSVSIGLVGSTFGNRPEAQVHGHSEGGRTGQGCSVRQRGLRNWRHSPMSSSAARRATRSLCPVVRLSAPYRPSN